MSGKNKKILIVEDDSAIADIYKTILKKYNFGVDVFFLGKDVISAIGDIKEGKKEKPDIILLDLILPDMDGMEILKEIKGNDATKDIKVFIMTNKENTTSENMGDIKPDEFLVKANTTPTQIIEIINRHL